MIKEILDRPLAPFKIDKKAYIISNIFLSRQDFILDRVEPVIRVNRIYDSSRENQLSIVEKSWDH